MSAPRPFTPTIPSDAPTPNWPAIEAIESLHPRSETMSWPKVVWQEFFDRNGTKHGRWVISQVVPFNATPLHVLDDDMPVVKDWNAGVWMPKAGRQLLLDLDQLDDGQQKVFAEFGLYSRPVLIVQGTRGGHKPFLSAAEEKILKLRGRDPRMPRLGELPYAPVSDKTRERLIELDATYHWRYAMDMRTRRPQDFEAAEQEELDKTWDKFEKWLAEHIEIGLDEEGISKKAAAEALASIPHPR